MDKTSVILMEMDLNGVLAETLGTFEINEHEKYLQGLFAVKTDDSYTAHVKLTAGNTKDFEDWQFNAIFDYYDETALPIKTFSEEADCFVPTWDVTFDFTIEEFESKLSDLLAAHNAEILSVLEAIADKEEEYAL
ncbi:hypothetical protein FACS189490_10450 [Clostridia bacterium]|nr:hypothetical protein FACS189490_10450 [Clostridia bacterium]